MRPRLAPDLGDVLRYVAGKYELSQAALLGRSRSPIIAEARSVAFYIARQEGLSFPRIGSFFGRDHTTVMHGVKRALVVMQREPVVAAVVEGWAQSRDERGTACEHVHAQPLNNVSKYATAGCSDSISATPVDDACGEIVDSAGFMEAAE